MQSAGTIKTGADVNGIYDTGMTLMEAVKDDDVKLLKQQLDSGADVNERDEHGSTALLYASRHGRDRCLTLLLEAGADVNQADTQGNTPLIEATIQNYLRSVQILLEAGADVNRCNEDNFTALNRAASLEYRSCMQLLLNAGADVNIPSKGGVTVLYHAIRWANVSDLAELIQAGADVNKAPEGAKRPLHIAAAGGNLDKVRVILRGGAFINVRDKFGRSALGDNLVRYDGSRDRGAMKELQLTLLAAGDTVDLPMLERRSWLEQVVQTVLPSYLCLTEPNSPCLKEACRVVIRSRLLQADSPVNLFVKSRSLGLPKPLVSYIMFNTTDE